jgi:hypothetical protein
MNCVLSKRNHLKAPSQGDNLVKAVTCADVLGVTLKETARQFQVYYK